VYLLQARAITAVPTRNVMRNQVFQKKPGFCDAVCWTRDNVGEVIPDPVTPLSWSVLDPLGNCSFAGVLRRLGLGPYPEAGLFGRFYGYVYFNQTLFQAMMSRFYPSRAGWRAAPRLALTALRALLLVRRLPGEGEGVIEMVRQRRRSEEGLDLAALTTGQVWDRLAGWRHLGVAVMEVHLLVSVMAELLYQALDKLSARWSDGQVTAAALTTGLTGVRSAESGQALTALARQICQDERLRGLVLATPAEALPAQLVETDAGRALWSQVEDFLHEHGHCAAQEFELAAPRWRDEPAIVLGVIQAHVRAARGRSRGAAPARLQAVAQIEERLWLPKRWLFRQLLRWTQSFIVARENLKYHFVVAHSRLRQLYLALAGQFVAAGQLTGPDDVFFLTEDEVEALAGGSGESVLDLVSKRRQARTKDRQTEPPLAFEQWADGRLRPASLSPVPEGGGQLLHGFAASPGSYTGRARVLHSPSAGAAMEPGEVLVAPATNPGWAPVLLAAGALVTEIGGVLSHGAIIAREYGLPAVLNVAGATRYIRTGQIVCVDGSQGTVRLLEEVM
jgi:pyruvate,water dikinase